MMRMRRFVVPMLCVLLNGCAGLPAYQPSAGESVANIAVSANMQSHDMQMCDNGACYVLKPADGQVKVPAGRRVSIYMPLVATGYRSTYSCSPGVSFVAKADVKYYANLEVRAEKCQFDIYRVDSASRVGITFEPTERPLQSEHSS
ncbi:hypothetical protein [Dyella sp. C11]|uniref:hypothetical protein n=1 Tax=Dyella sp. C11 TaxID=2126991 RepID=UPI000D65DEC5|nr:hypothetical protein [Dyella sp. C11]